MLLSEIFASVQGEGVSLGVPSVFVRFAECQLQCTWCDTKYTWDWDHHDRAAEVSDVPLDGVVAKIVALAGPGTRNVVLTGGEPLLHQDALVALATELRARGFRLEVETNGAIEPTAALRDAIDQWNVSPKLASSGNKASARLRVGPLTTFAALASAGFKFVACTPGDVDEIRAIAKTYAIAADRITIMPEGTTPEAIRDGGRALVEPCRAHGFRLGTRLHVLLWGSERGK